MKEKLKIAIRESIESNYKQNIFIKKDLTLPLGTILYDFLQENIEDLKSFRKSEDILLELAQYTTNKIVKIIIKTNQYVLITERLEMRIIELTKEFYKKIFENENPNPKELKVYLSEYQNKIIERLEEIEELKFMDRGEEIIEIIPCSQYDPEYQMSILKIENYNLKEPILDIGCGTSGDLVRKLRNLGLDAYGIDRKIEIGKPYLKELSWFEKKFDENRWGTIISHLSFTNHFKREHFKLGDGHIKYAKKYMEILNSLKIGGSFYYVPNLEFIEEFIPKEKFRIENNKLAKQSMGITSVKITKIK